MKKNLQITALALALGFATVSAQTGRQAVKSSQAVVNTQQTTEYPIHRTCGTGAPSAEWDAWFNKEVEKFMANDPNAKQMANYTIPVIVHVIHGGQAVGTGINLSQAQINSQITVLNADFAGTGKNATNVPTVFASAKANCNVTFCMATKSPTGATLAEPGIERISYTSKGWTNPASFSTSSAFQSYMDGTIKPASIWDPTRYLNIWVSDCAGSVGLLGYATFPAGSTLTGLSGTGTASTDGVWCWVAAFGSKDIQPTGYYPSGMAAYSYGRSATHEVGHWLGLRHIGGDGTCATDYCTDTPTQKGGFSGGQFGQNFGCPTHPYVAASECSGTTAEMFMNFMDYTDDACMYMFTNDQRTRVQTAMANGTYRSQLTASSATLCTAGASSPAVAAFTMTNSACAGAAITVANNSTGSPAPTYTWSSNPAGAVFSPNANSAMPTISFPSAGSYTVMLSASNGTLSTATNPIVITTCTVSTSCNDTLSNFKNTDTLTIYRTGTGSGCTTNGYVTGNNCYGDKEKAEYYSSTGLVSNAKVVGGIVLFYRNGTVGTKGSSTITFKMYNGNNTSGPSGAAINTHTNTLTNILAASTATNQVTYAGDPTLGFGSNIIRPYSFNFTSATNITGDFLLGYTVPTASGDTVAVFHNSGDNGQTQSMAWEMWSDNSWHKFNDGTSNTWQMNASIAVLPKIACITDVINMNGISGNLAVFPNPSNGVFNFAVTMPKASDLNFTVINSIGQVVYTKQEHGVTNSVIGMDLSHLPKGVYSVNVVDASGDKITRKIILQ
jgi:hypothetical protein